MAAAAGAVALARGHPSRRAALWGIDAEHLLPFEWAGPAGRVGTRRGHVDPDISRARDLICSAVGALPFTLWKVDFTSVPAGRAADRRRPAWMARPDPDRTRQWMLAWTADDLFFYGVAHWQITAPLRRPERLPGRVPHGSRPAICTSTRRPAR